jgi:thiol-disulfide isomerase/thioredoxin
MKSNLSANNCLLVLIFILCFCNKGVSQKTTPNRYPKIGDTCPAFRLNNLHYYKKSKADYSDFKGKPIILNFFAGGCKASFLTLPKLYELKKEFDGKVQFILIGNPDPISNVGHARSFLQEQYEKYQKYYHLDLIVNYDDSVSTLWNQFGVHGVPYTVLIDSTGNIRYLTTAGALTADRINKFIRGERMNLVVANNLGDSEMYYDPTKPLLIGGNGGPDSAFSYRSILSNWDYRTDFHRINYISSKNRNQINVTGADLGLLYCLAYGDTVEFILPPFPEEINAKVRNTYSQWYTLPVLNTKRKGLFKFDEFSGENLFNYSLIVPDSMANPLALQKMLKKELENCFSFKVSVEIRRMPCWKIVRYGNASISLRTKGGEPYWEESFSGVSFKNQPVSSLLLQIWSYYQLGPTFIDDTGINYNIDLDLKANMTDINDIRKALRKNGLDLVKGEKWLKTIVIRDQKGS